MKTIACLLTLVCGFVVVMVLSWPGQAQEQPAGPSPPWSAAQIDATWQEAQQLVAQGQLEQGADLYMSIVAGASGSIQSVQAALRAGHNYVAASRYDKALSAYDTVIALAGAQTWPNEDIQRRVKILRDSAVCGKARTLDQTGKHEDAAQLYGTLVNEVMSRKGPLVNITFERAAETIERAELAAQCLERAGKPAEAVQYYDDVLAVAEAKGWEDDPAEWASVYQLQHQRARTLCDKAKACAEAGLSAQALAATRQMRIEFSDCPAASEMAVLEAELSGGSVQQAESLLAQESQACELLKEINGQYNPGDPVDRTVDRLDQVIRDYPGTSGAVRALEAKGRVLRKAHRYVQSEAAFASLMNQLGGEAAFRSRLYQTARIQLAETQIKHLRARQLDRQATGDQEWDGLRALCSDIKNRGLRPLDRATAHFLLIESYGMQDRLAELLVEAEAFQAKYAKPRELPKRAPLVMWVDNFQGVALLRQKRYAEALEHFRAITQHYEATGTKPPNEGFMPLMYYRIWDVLRMARAPEDELDRAAQDLLIRFPDSVVAQRVAPRPVPAD